MIYRKDFFTGNWSWQQKLALKYLLLWTASYCIPWQDRHNVWFAHLNAREELKRCPENIVKYSEEHNLFTFSSYFNRSVFTLLVS